MGAIEVQIRHRGSRVTLLDRYLTRTIVVPAIAALLVVSFIFVANEMRQEMSQLIVQFATPMDLVRLGGALLPSLMPLILPSALFFGVLIGYGRLVERGELTAMRAAGVSLARMVAPAVVVGLLVSIGTIAIQDLLLPRTMQYARNLLRVELPKRATLNTISPGVMHPFGDWRVYFGSRDATAQELRDVVVVRQEPGEGAVVYHAESAKASTEATGATLRLGRGYWVSADGLRASCESTLLHLPTPERPSSGTVSSSVRTIAQLIEGERELTHELTQSKSISVEKKLRRMRSTLAERLSLPFGALLFGCVGAPLAIESSRYRRGGRQRLLATGLLVMLGYYLLHTALQANDLRPLSTTFLIAWIPNGALAVVAAVLLTRTARVH